MPARPSDFTTLDQVESFLNLSLGNAGEQQLYTLINNLSNYLVTACSREFALQYVSEIRNGNGQRAMMVLSPPIVALHKIEIFGTGWPAASGTETGIVWDEDSVSLGGFAPTFGTSAAGWWLAERFPVGHLNVRVSYTMGYALPNQAVNDWQANTTYYPQATIQPITNNPGNFIFEYQRRPGSRAGMSGATRPTFNQDAGSSTTDNTVHGGWINLGITELPDGLPLDMQQACAEIVATRYRQSARWADSGTGLGPERVNYFMGDMAASTKRIVDIYSQQTPIAR